MDKTFINIENNYDSFMGGENGENKGEKQCDNHEIINNSFIMDYEFVENQEDSNKNNINKNIKEQQIKNKNNDDINDIEKNLME